MKPASFETAIRLQFDTLVKRVIYCTVKNYEKELGRRAKHETPFSEISDIIIGGFSIEDNYEMIEKIIFSACGIPVSVQEGELAEALKKLPEIKRNVLLLSYFEEYPDSTIAKLMDVTRNGIFKRRMAALKLMKEILQEDK
ncbi:sigma factor-like helix-turn-helix DNA-binding protein [Clostridium culturomicium]|uniref:sigma factor-like helix-turn-helix DNA-binding protein n=1 Tax=Clostridium culturomicium TaxID=1499683 RepID=UPI00058B4343|nr:sigma factor-like helix-turn-helix DNA-binding protein [Clostridium culturomicium]